MLSSFKSYICYSTVPTVYSYIFLKLLQQSLRLTQYGLRQLKLKAVTEMDGNHKHIFLAGTSVNLLPGLCWSARGQRGAREGGGDWGKKKGQVSA